MMHKIDEMNRTEVCESIVDTYFGVWNQVEPDCFFITQNHWKTFLPLWDIKNPDELTTALSEGRWKTAELRKLWHQLSMWGSV